MLVDPNIFFEGTVLIAIPHSDDETLGCGAAISEIKDKGRLFFAYVSDSSRSPDAPKELGHAREEIQRIRQAEARSALNNLGACPENVFFLDMPDGRLGELMPKVESKIAEVCDRVRPDVIVVPFRYDSHPDHLAVNRAVTNLIRTRRISARKVEYFVYFRLRLLPSKDIRTYVNPKHMFWVGSATSLAVKRSALECYASQTTLMFPWQSRQLLTSEMLDSAASGPECYFQEAGDGSATFTIPTFVIGMVHWLEPRLKKSKDRWVSRLKKTRSSFLGV